jgi:hypothetical protein
MTMHLRRQVAIRTAKGIIDTLPEGHVFPYRLTDVLPKYVLNISNGGYSTNSIELNASDSYTIPLPANYDSANRLACFFRADSICKVVIVDPELGTSTFLLKATQGSTKGDHKGILMWQGRVTSITVSVPATYDDTIIDYFLWNIPDLTLDASWQIGNQALGVIS